ncbi:MAG: class II aldolase/adducin family protein, partial [Pseudomonadota bacterium]|nr:class II aldolase/adducin family protein [Pseudomonadota bacterium]
DIKCVEDTVSAEEWEARIDLAACYRLIRGHNWNLGIFNHCSIRVPDEPEYFLIKAHALLWDEVTASNLVKVNMNDELDETSLINRPGFVLHSAIYRARADVNAIVHIHEESSVAVSSTNDGLLPLTQDAIFLYGQVGYHQYSGITENAEERESIIRNLAKKPAMLMQNHGSVTVGETMGQAYSWTERLVKASKIQLQLLATGAELVTPSEEMCQYVSEQYIRHIKGRGLDDWPAALRELDQLDPSYRT